MELPRIGNEAIKKELNCNCSCRAHDIYVRMLSKESTHDRALSVRGTLVWRRPERSVEVASRVL